MKRIVWGFVVAGLTLTGCARVVSRTVNDLARDEPPEVPINPSPDDEPEASSPTESSQTTDAPAPDSPTTVAIPAEPLSCAEFEALLGAERMMAVKNETAPTDGACEAAVDRSALALNTYETGLEFSVAFGDADFDDLATATNCDEPAVMRNIFDVAVIYWGLTLIMDGDEVASYEPYITGVLQPGDTAPVDFVGNDVGNTCTLVAEGIVAPIGGLANGIDAAPAPSDDPQASDDPDVWGPELFGGYTPGMDLFDYLNGIEDVHSPDVGYHLRGIEAGETDTTPDQGVYTVCSSQPADLGPDVAGEYSWLVVAEQSDFRDVHHLGLFTRGADRRWRFLGTTALIDEEVDPDNPCALPPRSSG